MMTWILNTLRWLQHTCLSATSLNNKIRDFQGLIYSSDYNVVGVTETWLTTNTWKKKYYPVALTLFYRKDCKSRRDRVILAINGTVAGTLLETHLK